MGSIGRFPTISFESSSAYIPDRVTVVQLCFLRLGFGYTKRHPRVFLWTLAPSARTPGF
jgi:hypothetical protein